MLAYIIDHYKGFETLGREDRFKFLMDTPDEAILLRCQVRLFYLLL